MIQLEISWILGIIGTLAGVVATLSGLLWSTMTSRLRSQDRIIEGLRADVERLSKGCGIQNCHWRLR